MRYTCTRTMPFITLLKCHYNIYCVPFPHFWLFVYTLHLFFCNLLFFVVMCVVALCKLVNNDAHTHTHTHTHTQCFHSNERCQSCRNSHQIRDGSSWPFFNSTLLSSHSPHSHPHSPHSHPHSTLLLNPHFTSPTSARH